MSNLYPDFSPASPGFSQRATTFQVIKALQDILSTPRGPQGSRHTHTHRHTPACHTHTHTPACRQPESLVGFPLPQAQQQVRVSDSHHHPPPPPPPVLSACSQVWMPRGCLRAVWVGARGGEGQWRTGHWGRFLFSEKIFISTLIAISGLPRVSDSARVAEPSGKSLLARFLQLLFLGQTYPVIN